MRIDSSAVGMESARSYRASGTTVRRFMIMDYQQNLAQGKDTLNAGIESNAQNTGDTVGKEAGKTTEGNEKKVTTLQDWQARFQASASNLSIRSSVSQTFEDIRQQTIRYIFDLLFPARRNRWDSWMQDNGIQQNTESQNTVTNTDGESQGMYYDGNGLLNLQPRELRMNVQVLDYCQETYFTESEDVAFSTVGKVRTSDGREIDFNVNIGMSRRFEEYYREDLQLASFTMCDPLVINLDTDVAQLEDQTFYFDIDGDGELDEVSQLGAGSGYLALDKNGDGIINDGNELFGTSSGNGFADLAKYDQDGNGWIDENDEIWSKLKIWSKDENGKDVLYTLAEKGVGAICLKNASTDFTQKGQDGRTLGAVRNTGVFLYENGNVGTVQHVDVAKYYKEA